MIGIKLDGTRHKQIQTTTAVVIAPSSTRGPASYCYSRLFSDVAECTIVIVAIEAILAKVRDVDIRPAIVIEICDGYSEAPALVGDSGFFGHVSEGTVTIVVEQHGPGRGLSSLQRGKCGAVQHIDIQPAVVIVVDQTDARAVNFDDRGLLQRPAAMFEGGEPGLSRVIFVDSLRPVHHTACGYWAMILVIYSRVLSAGYDSGRFGRLRLRVLKVQRKVSAKNWCSHDGQQRKHHRAAI